MKTICYTKPTDDGLLLYFPSKEVRAEILHLYESSKDKYNGYMKVELSKPYKSRSNEQNKMFWAMVQQIASETGNDLEDIEQALKERACKRGFPYRINKISGRIRPYSMTECDTVQMGYLIDETIQLCAELGINPDLNPQTEIE